MCGPLSYCSRQLVFPEFAAVEHFVGRGSANPSPTLLGDYVPLFAGEAASDSFVVSTLCFTCETGEWSIKGTLLLKYQFLTFDFCYGHGNGFSLFPS